MSVNVSDGTFGRSLNFNQATNNWFARLISYNAREASVKLAEATGADCVQVIGSKFVLYLQKKKDSAYADLLK